MPAHDFTPQKYSQLIDALGSTAIGYTLMHDVDLRPELALQMALAEHEMGVKSTYYFRSMHFRAFAEVIARIAEMGHRIGYHYEDLTTCKGDIAAAYRLFEANLHTLRQLAPVTTACAHGSPRSPWNSQDIWNQYDIHALGIEYEPMLDTDFTRTLYLTDTGRRWDGAAVSVRDKVAPQQKRWQREGLAFHSTDDIIHALSDLGHPIHHVDLLLNAHPQRWMPFGAAWVAEATAQWWKNQAKRLLVAAGRH